MDSLAHILGHTSRRAYFTSTQDLLAQFQLLPAYDKYVRPYATPVGIADTGQFAATTTIDKGKGKEKEILALDPSSPTAGQTPGGPNDGDDDDGQGKGEKKWKNNYKHLIKGVPGTCQAYPTFRDSIHLNVLPNR